MRFIGGEYMEILLNNLVFQYKGESYNVPLEKPWDIYKGELVPFSNYSDKVDREISDKISYFILHITEECNLACKYCFQSDKKNITMTDKEIKSFIDYIYAKNLDEVNIRFFGGEPLLAIDVIKKTINSVESTIEKYNLE